jgi:hypothetical protein
MSFILDYLQNMSDRVAAMQTYVEPLDLNMAILNLTERMDKLELPLYNSLNQSSAVSIESSIDRYTSLIKSYIPDVTIDQKIPLFEPIEPMLDVPQQGYPISSNIMQYLYYPLMNSIIITFSNMVDYQYWDVTLPEFNAIIEGNATCVSKGRNQFGEWFVGKTPSVGAAVYRFLVQANKPWRRL